MFVRAAAAFAVSLALLLAGIALAANKSATLVPPASYASGGWSIEVYSRSPAGATATNWCARTTFCALDKTSGAKDCVKNEECTGTPPPDIVAFINARLAAARAAHGY